MKLIDRAGMTGATLALLSCIGFATPAFAKKGGGGNPGGGGEDPPSTPAPINYAITWLTDASSTDDTRLWDIDPNGIAVGQLRPEGIGADKVGIISFPGRLPTDVEALVKAGNHSGDQLPTGWELTSAFSISDGLLIGGDLVADDGTWHCYAAQLSDDGTSTSVESFEIFPAPATSTRAFLLDASENGSYFVLRVHSTGAGGEEVTEIYQWSPRTAPEAPEMVVQYTRALTDLSVNNAGQICWGVAGNYDRDVFIYDPDLDSVVVVDDEPGFYGIGNDIGEDSTVVGGFTARRKGSSGPGLWTEAGGWESIPSDSRDGGTILAVNSARQMIGLNFDDDRPFFFSEADGFHRLDNLVVSGGESDDVARWNSSGSFWLWTSSHSLSDPGPEGYGFIAGFMTLSGDYDGRAFILTPVPVSTP